MKNLLFVLLSYSGGGEISFEKFYNGVLLILFLGLLLFLVGYGWNYLKSKLFKDEKGGKK